MNHKMRFIRAVIDKEIIIVNRPVKEIHTIMDKLGIPHDIYANSKTRGLSEDGIAELAQEISVKQQERAVIEQTSHKQMWVTDLDLLEKEYCKEYNVKNNNIALNITTPKIVVKKEPKTIPAFPGKMTIPTIKPSIKSTGKSLQLKIPQIK